jgi:hypothetical protein
MPIRASTIRTLDVSAFVAEGRTLSKSWLRNQKTAGDVRSRLFPSWMARDSKRANVDASHRAENLQYCPKSWGQDHSAAEYLRNVQLKMYCRKMFAREMAVVAARGASHVQNEMPYSDDYVVRVRPKARPSGTMANATEGQQKKARAHSPDPSRDAFMADIDTLKSLCETSTKASFTAKRITKFYHRVKIIFTEGNKVRGGSTASRDTGQEVLALLKEHAIAQAKHFEPRQIVILLAAHIAIRIKPHDDLLEAIKHQADAKISSFDAHSTSRFMWSLARLEHNPGKQLFETISAHTLANCEEFKPQDLSNIMWACSKLKMAPSDKVMGALCQRTARCAPLLKTQDIANTLYACAMLRYQPEKDVIDTLCKSASERVDLCNPQDITNILFALAHLGQHPGQDLIDRLSKRICECIWDFKMQAISDVMRAFALLKARPSHEVVTVLCSRASRWAQELDPHMITSLLWSCATIMHHPGKRVFTVLCRRACDSLGEFHAKDVGKLVWSCARLGEHPGKVLYATMCNSMSTNTHVLKADDVGRILWGCARLGEHPGSLLTILTRNVGKNPGNLSAENVANVLWACAVFGENTEKEALARLYTRARSLLVKNNAESGAPRPKDVARILWAYATLAHTPDAQLVKAACVHLTTHIDACDCEMIGQALWACAVFNHVAEGMRVLAAASGYLAPILTDAREPLAKRGACWGQICNFILSAELEGLLDGGKETLDLESGAHHANTQQYANILLLKNALKGHCSEAASGSTQRARFAMQRDVAATAERLYLSFEESAVDARSGYVIDVLIRKGANSSSGNGGAETITAAVNSGHGSRGDTHNVRPRDDVDADSHSTGSNINSRKIAVKIYGPSHYLGDGRTLTGDTLLRKRQLQLLGYKVVAIPYWEWSWGSGRGEERSKEDYLQRVIHA